MRLTHVARRVIVCFASVLAVTAIAPQLAGAHTRAHPAWAHTRTFGATTLTLDPAAAQALASLGVAPGVVAPAHANPDGSLSFPITDPLGRALATGVITHAGGISLTAGATSVDLTNFQHQRLPSDPHCRRGGRTCADPHT